MTEIDEVRCMDCGFEDVDPDTIPQKCPECGASTMGYHKEKLFADPRNSSGNFRETSEEGDE